MDVAVTYLVGGGSMACFPRKSLLELQYLLKTASGAWLQQQKGLCNWQLLCSLHLTCTSACAFHAIQHMQTAHVADS